MRHIDWQSRYCENCGENSLDEVGFCPECDYPYLNGEKTLPKKEPSEKSKPENKAQSPDILLHVRSWDSPEFIKKQLSRKFYTGITFEPDLYSVKYKCNTCGYEHTTVVRDYKFIPEVIDCPRECTKGLSGLIYMIASLFKGNSAFGYAKLVSQEVI